MSAICLIIHNIRSAENVGSIFRTSDAAGVSKIYLTGYTPAPTDRFGRAVSKIAKTALGAEQSVPWEQYTDVFGLIKKLKADGTKVVALEQAEDSVPYDQYKVEGPTALLVGNEVDGVEEGVLGACDAIIEIPMKGQKESLNVSVAAGIALFYLVK